MSLQFISHYGDDDLNLFPIERDEAGVEAGGSLEFRLYFPDFQEEELVEGEGLELPAYSAPHDRQEHSLIFRPLAERLLGDGGFQKLPLVTEPVRVGLSDRKGNRRYFFKVARLLQCRVRLAEARTAKRSDSEEPVVLRARLIDFHVLDMDGHRDDYVHLDRHWIESLLRHERYPDKLIVRDDSHT